MSLTLRGSNERAMDERESSSDFVARSIRQAIFDGSIASGFQLKQNDVAAELGVSAVPVREALTKLTSEGLLVNIRNKGVSVPPLSADDFTEITDLRLMLEPYLLRTAAGRLVQADYDQAEALLREDCSDSPVKDAQQHWAFHRLLYAKANRPRMIAQIDVLYISINRYLLPAWISAGLGKGWDDSHLQIIQALKNHDPDTAVHLLVEQINDATDRVRAFLKHTAP